MLDKTLKLRTHTHAARSDAAQYGNVEERNAFHDLAISAQLEDEKSKSLEHLKTIVQLRESLKQEKAKTAELEGRLSKLDEVAESQLARKTAQLEEERRQSLEYLRTIEQLRETIRQDHAKKSGMEKESTELEAITIELVVLKAKIKHLSEALNRISSIAATGKVVGED